MPVVADEGVCLRVWDWSETSQTLAVLTRGHGLLRCVAKGSKRGDARFSGGIEPLTRAEMQVSLPKSDAMSVLASWDLCEIFPGARRTLEGYYAGTTMLDAVYHCVQEHDPHADLYDVLVGGLRALAEVEGPSRGLLAVLWGTLACTGHAPDLTHDTRTGGVLGVHASYVYDARRGGLTTDTPSHAHEPGALRVRGESVGVLRDLEAGRVVTASRVVVERVTRLLAHAYREVFAVEPPTFRRLLAPGGGTSG